MPKTISSNSIIIEGARENNLKNIDVSIPRNQFVVITGLSGSGKSSLAFNTIYAEGQRRYIESFSAYARQFLGTYERPDVDKISGLCPVIAIDQKTTNKNPRSTVGTITEVYDFLRVLYARVSDAISYKTGEKMVKYSQQEIIRLIGNKFDKKNIILLAPVIQGRKGHYKELFQKIAKSGFLKVRINGVISSLTYGLALDRYKTHNIDIVIDQIEVTPKAVSRITNSVKTAFKHSKGNIIIIPDPAYSTEGIPEVSEDTQLSKNLMCPTTGASYSMPEPNSFSFNSPYGACPTCKGTGFELKIDINKVIPNRNLSIGNGCIEPIGRNKNSWIYKQIESILKMNGYNSETPFKDLSKEVISVILYGANDTIMVNKVSDKPDESGILSSNYTLNYEGIISFIEHQQKESPSSSVKKWASGFMHKNQCHICSGTRLKRESQFFKLDGKSISEITGMEIKNLLEWLKTLEGKLDKKKSIIAKELIKELLVRVQFLQELGLGYLTLNRSAQDLSGGESQRIRLATQMGTQLVGVLYVLDEPSIGLHPKDNNHLINSLKKIKASGNSVIVVEHDKETILAADYIMDFGPQAGAQGGQLVGAGSPQNIQHTLTGLYLTGKKSITIPNQRRIGNKKTLSISGMTGNNLKNISADFPLGTFICVTGVSGSGKSTMVTKTLYPILHKAYYTLSERISLPYQSVKGLDALDKVIEVSQSPIGRTPRSNPATYTGVFTDIRNLFTSLPESKIRGYKLGRFSFNVKGGRCETCKGAGLKTIEMNFLPDVHVTCEKCQGKRYNRETLEVRYKGKSINDVLEMTIDEAVPFFNNIPSIIQKIKTLQDVGMGYITLGQASTTLSGGEAQRVKLATELSKKSTGRSFYILDEPSTGLHFEDVRVLLNVLNKLVEKGNTVLVIEHNLDIIKMADYLIDLGPEGGYNGGEIVFQGCPENIVKCKKSATGKFLKKELHPN